MRYIARKTIHEPNSVSAAHLPALQVVIPLISAPLCLLLRRDRLAWALTLIVSWLVLAVAILLLDRVMEQGSISYALGGWAAPWGIEYRVDATSAFVLVIVAVIGSVVVPYSYASVAHEIPRDRIYLFYTCYLLCLTGLLGITITGDAFNLFVFLEISSLSSYVLISLGRDRRALTAAFQYLIMGTIGATFILIGVGLLYMMTGTLNMADLAERLPTVSSSRTVIAAFAFITVGESLKLALFPLHLWLPNAYTYAPSAVSAFLAATATKVGVYVLLRFFFTVFGRDFSFEVTRVGEILLVLALVATLVASTVAFFQENVKRMLAYSSVAQVGYMILGASFATVDGLTASIIHLFNHALIKGGLFLALGCVFLRIGSVRIRDMEGLSKTMPLTMAAFVIGGLSLIGVPLTSGFISKWYLVQASLELGWWVVAVLILVSSLIAVAYVWRVVEAAYFRNPGPHAREAKEAPAIMLVSTWVLIGANLYFGIDASVSLEVARRAAETLIGTGP
jgi:multicomponent Na+:H+ antiporter subunit D